LPAPGPTVSRALGQLPHEPGVYIFREAAGRIVYIGRSRDLRRRVHSYWSHLGERPHLRRMVERVEWVEPVVCTSEHEAAFLESDLLARHPTRFNRTLGMESQVWLRLSGAVDSPGLEVVHEAHRDDGATWFGPYLGWEPTRQAAAGLLRLYPLHYSGRRLNRSEREMARSLGVAEADRPALAERIAGVLRREPVAVRAAMRGLERTRDRSAERLMFEHAAEVQEQIRGIAWITEPQKLCSLEPIDGDFTAVAGASGTTVLVMLSLREGRLAQRHVRRLAAGDARQAAPVRRVGTSPDEREWATLATRNARLMARLAAVDAIGPLGWRG
jgi:excinuclease ABC subunit C